MNVVQIHDSLSASCKRKPALVLVALSGTTIAAASATERWVTSVRIIGAKAIAADALPTPNTAILNYGYNDGAASPTHTIRGSVPVWTSAGDEGVMVAASVGQRFDLRRLSLQATSSGDKAVLEFIEDL
jgi:hypothetical protein